MLFFAAGVFTTPLLQQIVTDHRIAILTSFADQAGLRRSLPALASRLRGANTRLDFMLDSGAFGAWSRGCETDLRAYIDCANRIIDDFSDCLDITTVALDRIAGRKGVWPTVAEAEAAAIESQRNYDLMRERVRGYVLPVFHAVDPRWLAKYFDKHAEYLGLGVSQDLGSEARRRWVATAAPYFAKNRLHGFAATGSRMLRSARWHSVDSAAWAKWAAYGCIAWVRADGRLQTIPVSRQSPHARDHRRHIDNCTAYLRDRMHREFSELGFTPNQMRDCGDARAAFNAVQFQRACDIASVTFAEVA
jgi:hypothetical protein